MSAAELAVAQAVLELRECQREWPRKFFEPDPWQVIWFAGAGGARQALLMAGNQIGKTQAAAFEYSCHLTGDYPEWWIDLPSEFMQAIDRWPDKSDKPYTGPSEWPTNLPSSGLVLEYAPLVWCMGVTGENIRDNLQKQLFGDMNARSNDDVFLPGGMVHPSEIAGRPIPAPGTSGLAKDVYVQHKTGKRSTCSLKTYSQGQHVLMGPKPDFVGIDEEPVDPTIYPQCVIRTMNSNQGRGGYVRLTFTPENGATELVLQFTEELGESQYYQNATWADAAHITVRKREQLLDAIPPYQHKMRELGIPVLGEGAVYPVLEDTIKCDPFPIPEHFRVISGMDFGVNKSSVWLALNEDTDVMYVYDVYTSKDDTVTAHASAIRQRGMHIPVSYPPFDGDARESSGDELILTYQNEGMPPCVAFANPDGSKYVSPGVSEILNRMQTGRFKVFSHLEDWFKEFRLYHRKNGKIVKTLDHTMDATRMGAQKLAIDGVYNRRLNVARRTRPSRAI